MSVIEVAKLRYKDPFCLEESTGFRYTDNANTSRTQRRMFHCLSCLQEWQDSKQKVKSTAPIVSVKSGDRCVTQFRSSVLNGTAIIIAGTVMKRDTPTIPARGGSPASLGPSALPLCFSLGSVPTGK